MFIIVLHGYSQWISAYGLPLAPLFYGVSLPHIPLLSIGWRVCLDLFSSL